MEIGKILKELGIKEKNYGSSTGQNWGNTTSDGELKIVSPTDGKHIASVYQASAKDFDDIIKTADDAFKIWRKIPAPKRGDIVRQIGVRLRDYKKPLGTLVSYEMGKSIQEGWGEVQEMIDICDFAVGLSRQLYGFTMQSERPSHRMYDQYHPLGIVATISAFNFPIAVWSWNAIIISPDADLKLAIPAVLFGSVGTAGQRCTTTRRLIIHESIFDKVKAALVKAYGSVKIGDPLDEKNHMGPLIDKSAIEAMQNALQQIKKEGGKIFYGGEVLTGKGYESGCYVKPCLAEVENQYKIVQEETFAPILYLIKYEGEIEQAIKLHNDVPQGLSSAIFTNNLREAEEFLSCAGSDCGIANVNIGTSGAEIGGAFGGEKETGGGRESGSDAWKAYMRRQTNTINYSAQLPLAQGIRFGEREGSGT